MKRLMIGLLLSFLAQEVLAGDVDSSALTQLQGQWVVEEWTGYKPLAMYEGYMSVSKDNDYSGSRLTVEVRVSP